MSDPRDCSFRAAGGRFNYRVGAIIAKGDQLLLARNPLEKRAFYYSVGGKVRFGESLEEALLRELREETGLDCKLERLAAIHENFFPDDDGVLWHELAVFFTVQLSPELAAIESGRRTDHGPAGEYLEWVDRRDCAGLTIYPGFFRTVDFSQAQGVLHVLDRE